MHGLAAQSRVGGGAGELGNGVCGLGADGGGLGGDNGGGLGGGEGGELGGGEGGEGGDEGGVMSIN